MTLWMPLLDYAQSAKTMVRQTREIIPSDQCAVVMNIDVAQIAALRWYGHLDLRKASPQASCPWLLTEPAGNTEISATIDRATWAPHTLVRHPVAGSEMFWILKRLEAN